MHIIYFLLLLFCTSTNMIHSMHSEELTRLQKNYSNAEPLSQQLLAKIFPPKPAAQQLIKTEPSDGKYSNTLSNTLSNHLSSNSSSILQQSLPRALTRALTRKRKLAQEQSENGQRQKIDIAEQQSILPSLALMINTQSLSETESLISSDVECSTLQPSLRQPPRKKRKVNKKDIPDNACFTITCNRCFPEEQLYTPCKSHLICNFKKHLKNKHPNITEEQTKIYITKHLQKPERLVIFSVHCPESECKHITHAGRNKGGLKINLFIHISAIHPENKDNYSRESVAKHIKDNCKMKFVSAKKKLKNTNFAIICPFCSDKQQLQALLKYNLISNFKRHLKKKHPDITEKQAQIYIGKHLQEPELRTKFSIQCPEFECEHIIRSIEKNKLKTRLFEHVSTQHSKNNDSHSKESISTYVDNNYQQTVIPAQK